MRSVLALLAVACLPALGCRPAVPRGPVPARPMRHPEAPATVVTVSLTLDVPVAPAPAPIDPLPAFAPFDDPFPIPVRALQQQRILAYNLRGEPRQRAMTDLAARLWQLAQDNAAQLRSGGAASDPAAEKALRGQITAHLHETVVLLEQVLEQPAAPASARMRLAHYLRELNPRAAIPHLQALVAQASDPARRSGYRLDLAQILLQEGRPTEAANLLRSAPADRAAGRGLLLHLLALGYSEVDTSVASLLPTALAARARPDPILVAHLPRLVARTEHPEAFVPGLVKAAGQGARQGVVRCVGELLAAGRPEAALAVSRAARTHGVTINSSLARTLADMTSASGGAPPSPQRLREALAARAPALRRCLPISGRPLTISLVIASTGRVVPGPGSPCAEAFGAWILPGWSGASRLRLVLTIPPAPALRPRPRA